MGLKLFSSIFKSSFSQKAIFICWCVDGKITSAMGMMEEVFSMSTLTVYNEAQATKWGHNKCIDKIASRKRARGWLCRCDNQSILANPRNGACGCARNSEGSS